MQDEVARTDEIFLARVVRAQETRSGAGKDAIQVNDMVSVVETDAPMANIAVRYRLLKSLKGDPRQVGTVHTSYNNCSSTLLPGNEYVLFVTRDARRGLRMVRFWPYGTRQFAAHDPRSIDYVSSIERILNNPPKKNFP